MEGEAEMVRVEVADWPEKNITLFWLSDVERPPGGTDIVKDTLPEKPPRLVRRTAVVFAELGRTVR